MILKNVVDIFVPFLWALLALGTLLYFLVVRRTHGWLVAVRRLFSHRILWPLAGVVAVNLASASLVFIDPREVGVVVSLLAPQGVREQPMDPGLHLKVPLFEEVIRYPVIVQSYTMSGRAYEGEELGDDAIRARTADGQLVIIDVTLLFRIRAEMAVNLHINWQDRYIRDFIRPGLRAVDSWAYGDVYPVWGMAQTPSDQPGGGDELSLYASEGCWRGTSAVVRRYTLRIDGFVSLQAPLSGGEMVSKPLTFKGSRLSLNVSTSAAGWLRVGLTEPDGSAIPGFALDDCWKIVGDTLDYTVTWKGGDLSSIAGRPVRMHLRLADADLYSFQFC